MTLQEEITRRRTFAVIAHPDAGKTTLTEKLLLFGGAIHVDGSGNVEGGAPEAQFGGKGGFARVGVGEDGKGP